MLSSASPGSGESPRRRVGGREAIVGFSLLKLAPIAGLSLARYLLHHQTVV
jgi:hypothetical protein